MWIGKDDNSPMRGATGGGTPAQIWRDFMSRAIPGAAPRAAPRPEPEPDLPQIFDDLGGIIDASLGGRIGDAEVRIGDDGAITVEPREPDPPKPPG